MIKLDNDWLIFVGLGALPATAKNDFLAHVHATLELRVGLVVAERMNDAQLTEFQSFIEAGDQDGARQHLDDNIQGHRDIVHQQFEALTEEITALAPQILAVERGQQQTES